MSERDDKPGRPQRDDTDESLRVERAASDTASTRIDETLEALEEDADETLRATRERADQVVRTTRRDADRDRERAPTDESTSERERSRVDRVLEHEREHADAALDHERSERRRYLADFLAVEREATNRALSSERSDADASLETHEEFLATVSHDLRSLLGGLSLNAELLLRNAPEGEAGEPMRRFAGTSQRLLARMNRLVNDLIDVASISAGKLALLLEPVELVTILRDTLEAFEPIAAARGVELVAEAEATPLLARIDADRILQVLANLVSNALKFTPEGGQVTIRAGTEDDALHLAVSDTGIGIPEDALEQVFERYHQLGEHRHSLGLGLYISRGIVEAHGGQMRAESTVGAGTTFHVVLPGPQLVPPSRGDADPQR